MNIFLLISIISFISFMNYFIYKCGIQPSISNYFYVLPEDQKWLFTAFLWSFSTPLMVAYDSSFLFLAGAFICLVGVNQHFRERMDEFTHFLFAIGGISLGMLSLIFNFKMYHPVILFGIIAAVVYLEHLIKNKTFWIEMSAIVIILISLIFIK